ncbi:MAG: hypothetical protein ACXWED_02780 [Solirubrobacterales bacterium]
MLLFAACLACLTAVVVPAAQGATTSGTFTAAGPNNVPAAGGSGIAQTYPWKLSVSGMSGNTNNVDVTLWGIVHSRVPDIDALLVGPNGAGNSLFMSDIGDATPITAPGVNLTFDDEASASAPVGAALATGTYKPTNGNGGDGDAFPSPAPSGSYANLAALNGHSPNGTWNLYLNDDDGTGVDPGTGSVQSWSLTLSTVVTTKTKKKKSKKKKTSTRRNCSRFRSRRHRVRCKCRHRQRFAAAHPRKCRRAFRHRRR